MTDKAIHPSMQRIYDHTGLNANSLADAINEASQTVYNWDKRGISKQGALKVSDKFNLDTKWILSGQGSIRPLFQIQSLGTMTQSQAGQSQGQIQVEPWKSHLMALEPWEDGDEPDPDEVDLPFFDDVSFAAGDGSFLIQVGMNAQRKLRFLRATLEAAGVRIEDAACAKNSGTSMEDLIRDGATIGIDISKAQYPIKDGKIYAMFHGGMLRIKYLYRLPGGGVRLRSHNRDEYEDEDLFGDKLNDFRVLGWVFWWSTVDRW